MVKCENKSDFRMTITYQDKFEGVESHLFGYFIEPGAHKVLTLCKYVAETNIVNVAILCPVNLSLQALLRDRGL